MCRLQAFGESPKGKLPGVALVNPFLSLLETLILNINLNLDLGSKHSPSEDCGYVLLAFPPQS